MALTGDIPPGGQTDGQRVILASTGHGRAQPIGVVEVADALSDFRHEAGKRREPQQVELVVVKRLQTGQAAVALMAAQTTHQRPNDAVAEKSLATLSGTASTRFPAAS